MQNPKSNDHKHGSCCDHEHSRHDVQSQSESEVHKHGHEHVHEHSHHHTHGHNESHQHHTHGHHHDHDCCADDHAHSHQHLNAHECTTLFNRAHSIDDASQAIALLIEAGCGFAHLGDAAGTAAVNALLKEKFKTAAELTSLQRAQIGALTALELSLTKAEAKPALEKSIVQLENLSSDERLKAEQLLADVRKALAAIRTTGLKSLLNKLKL